MRTASDDARALSSVPPLATERVAASSDGTSVHARWVDFEAFVREAEPRLSRALRRLWLRGWAGCHRRGSRVRLRALAPVAAHREPAPLPLPGRPVARPAASPAR